MRDLSIFWCLLQLFFFFLGTWSFCHRFITCLVRGLPSNFQLLRKETDANIHICPQWAFNLIGVLRVRTISSSSSSSTAATSASSSSLSLQSSCYWRESGYLTPKSWSENTLGRTDLSSWDLCTVGCGSASALGCRWRTINRVLKYLVTHRIFHITKSDI